MIEVIALDFAVDESDGTCDVAECDVTSSAWYETVGVYLGEFCVAHAAEFEAGLGRFAPR